jgi:hypothetical protein
MKLDKKQDPILWLDKILENLYNQISPKTPEGLWTLRFIFWEWGKT